MRHPIAAICLACACTATTAGTLTGSSFVNGMALDGGALDRSAGSAVERRLGFFSDLYYDPGRNEWWGLSDRGPGGGLLNYATRAQRFTLDVAPSGAISNFQVVATIKFSDAGAAMDGIAPNPSNQLGRAFDPEGFVVLPRSGNLLVSDEYGPSLIEFDRSGALLRRFTIPENLVPRNTSSGVPNFASDSGNTAGKRSNRGFEGLAVSPDGKFAYAMLQSAMLDEGGGSGRYARIVKFDTTTGQAVAQYAYLMDTASQGRGISALVALGNDKFLVLERNNRGIGVGATLAGADKAVYQIDLAGAVDVSGITLPASGAGFAGAVSKSAKLIDLDANTLAALGGLSPEKWEGLTVGPQIGAGRYLLLAGTDNDYSVTQSGQGEQFDAWFDFALADPYASSIQCPIGQTSNCFLTTGGAPAQLGPRYALLPGVLHAYAADIDGYVRPAATIATPGSAALVALGLLGLLGRRSRRSVRPAMA
jgi:hypothetical protein